MYYCDLVLVHVLAASLPLATFLPPKMGKVTEKTRKVLSLQQKTDIIKRLEAGAKPSTLAAREEMEEESPVPKALSSDSR